MHWNKRYREWRVTAISRKCIWQCQDFKASIVTFTIMAPHDFRQWQQILLRETISLSQLFFHSWLIVPTWRTAPWEITEEGIRAHGLQVALLTQCTIPWYVHRDSDPVVLNNKAQIHYDQWLPFNLSTACTNLKDHVCSSVLMQLSTTGIWKQTHRDPDDRTDRSTSRTIVFFISIQKLMVLQSYCIIIFCCLFESSSIYSNCFRVMPKQKFNQPCRFESQGTSNISYCRDAPWCGSQASTNAYAVAISITTHLRK
jgi:hypothetical protein